MFSIIAAALKQAFSWLVSGSVIKFVIFSALAYVVATLTDVIESVVDFAGMGGVGDLFGLLPDSVLYFVGLARLDVGIPMIVAAYVVRFGIRRLPVIG